jgi:hypothetical protein
LQKSHSENSLPFLVKEESEQQLGQEMAHPMEEILTFGCWRQTHRSCKKRFFS